MATNSPTEYRPVPPEERDALYRRLVESHRRSMEQSANSLEEFWPKPSLWLMLGTVAALFLLCTTDSLAVSPWLRIPFAALAAGTVFHLALQQARLNMELKSVLGELHRAASRLDRSDSE